MRSSAVHPKPSCRSVQSVTATKSIMRPSLVNDVTANKMEKATRNDSLKKMPPKSTTLNANTFPSKMQTLPKTAIIETKAPKVQKSIMPLATNTNEKAGKDRLMPNTLMTVQRKNVANNNLLTLPTPIKAHPTTQR